MYVLLHSQLRILNNSLDASNDAHCALVIYERLMALAEENKVVLEPEKYTYGVKYIPKKPDSSGGLSRKPGSVVSSSSEAQKPASRGASCSRTVSRESAAASSGSETRKGKVNTPKDLSNKNVSVRQRPQHIRAYSLWYGQQMPLDEMCKTLRSADNPLKIGTVM